MHAEHGVAVDDHETRACVAENPVTFQEWWTGPLLSLRVDLRSVAPVRARELIMEAWFRKAPKRLAASLPDRTTERRR